MASHQTLQSASSKHSNQARRKTKEKQIERHRKKSLLVRQKIKGKNRYTDRGKGNQSTETEKCERDRQTNTARTNRKTDA